MIARLATLLVGLVISCVVCANEGEVIPGNDHIQSWQQWQQERKAFLLCTSNAETTKFLSDSIELHGNSELEEAYNSAIALGVINNPSCVLGALVELPEPTQQKVINIYIVRPLFDDIKEIEGAMSAIWSDQKYQYIKSEFLRLMVVVYGE